MKKNKRIGIFLVVYIICICLICLINYKIDPDYLWHIKAGEYMFKHGLLRHDVFSWSMNGKYWVSHEWLFEIFIYFLKLIFGKIHIFIYCFSTTSLLMLSLVLTNKKNIMKNLTFSIFWLSLFVISMFYVQVRPHMISFIFLSLSIYLLYDLYKNEKSKKIYFLPIISIVWSNVHGGSSNLPYLLCLLFIIGGLFNFKFSKIESKRLSKIQIRRYIVVMLLCMIGVFINIHGYKMFLYPYQNIIDKKMIENILEWKSTSLNEWTSYIYLIFVVVITFIMLLSKKKIELIDLLLFGFSLFLGLKSVRFWFYTYIVMSYVIYNYIGKSNDIDILEVGMGILSFVFIIVFFINVHKLFPRNYYFSLKEEDIQYIKSLDSKRLYNSYNFGGDLIYNDIPVFIDGRADLYSKDVFDDYLTLSNLDGDFYSIICKYGFDYYVVENNSNIDYYLRYRNEYSLLYCKNDMKIYKKMS